MTPTPTVRRPRLSPLRLALWGAVGVVLLTPLVAMRLSDQVVWTGSDFLFAALLLIGGGLVIELALRFVRDRRLALGVAALVLLGVLLIWAQGAVGVF